MAHGRGAGGTAGCESCFFAVNMLCAISASGPCATYRPDHPEGLRPPSQMRFVFRQERRLQVAWTFPTAGGPPAFSTVVRALTTPLVGWDMFQVCSFR